MQSPMILDVEILVNERKQKWQEHSKMI